MREHSLATEHNTRLKNRLGVVEALLPVRVQPGEDLARLAAATAAATATAAGQQQQQQPAGSADNATAAWGSCGGGHTRRSSSMSRSESADHSAGGGGQQGGQGEAAPAPGLLLQYSHDSPATAPPTTAAGGSGSGGPGAHRPGSHERSHPEAEPGTAVDRAASGAAVGRAAARLLCCPPQPQHDQQHQHHTQSPALERLSQPEQPSQHSIEAATEQWLAAWRVWVREAALLSVAYTTRPSEQYLRKIDAAFERVCEEAARIWYPLGHPDVICGAYQLNVDTGLPETPPDSHWREVAEGMGVNAQQVAACRAALALYRERMEVVMAERGRLTERLADSMAAAQRAAEGPHPVSSPSGGSSGGSLGSAHYQQAGVEAEAAAAALDANVAAEGRATRLAREFLRSNILTSLQRAKCASLSYPFYPDALAIIAAMASLPGLPQPAGPETEQQAAPSEVPRG
ncbi:hypothetical protein HYH02_000324 [Chlamydomonas schloesseri]|uniref:Uncharacterized protein n=1 Tax=Chlamydomonas schloesseri TaxID=2026947 RepID=A0A835WLZ2_9CHLO|nr:hypothetical protein HYH02_000324 [Chlamydomonas schloesseri]|eukprot:KAG2450223.1 hypothetical protein HYH02_000324 [Chlamydomonas schloesseri]